MKVTVDGTQLNLNDELCMKFNEKVLYDITENECRLYAEAFFDKSFEEIVTLYPIESIAKVIENAMKEEIDL